MGIVSPGVGGTTQLTVGSKLWNIPDDKLGATRRTAIAAWVATVSARPD